MSRSRKLGRVEECPRDALEGMAGSQLHVAQPYLYSSTMSSPKEYTSLALLTLPVSTIYAYQQMSGLPTVVGLQEFASFNPFQAPSPRTSGAE